MRGVNKTNGWNKGVKESGLGTRTFMSKMQDIVTPVLSTNRNSVNSDEKRPIFSEQQVKRDSTLIKVHPTDKQSEMT